MLGNMLVNPAQRLRDITNDRVQLHVRQQSIVGGDEEESLFHKDLRFELDAGFIARLPAAAVNPEDHGQVLRITRRINIEHLPFMRRIGIGGCCV